MIQVNSNLQWGDYVVISLYFVGVIFTGLWAARISKGKNLQGYFLASRSMHWIPVGASLFASNIGSEHFIGLAGSGAAGGIAVATFELVAIFVLMLLGWMFVPVYLSAGVFTMPEYLKKRFGGERIRIFLSSLSLLLYILTKISANLFSGALFIKLALGFEGDEGLYFSVLILLGLAALFTIGGGLTAVIWTDFVQSILMLLGSMVLMGLSLDKVGGYQIMLDKYKLSIPPPEYSAFRTDKITGENISCSQVDPNFMHLVRPVHDNAMPWTGIFNGVLINSIWYWCADQVIVQRTLSAKNVTHAKAGCVLAALLKLTPLFTLVIPGMAARVLYTNDVACSDPKYCKSICYSETGCSNIAFVKLVLHIMPHGLRGIMLAVMLAAVMSSLTSIFNSASTIFTVDIWTKLRNYKASTIELLIVGRCFIVLFCGLSIAWIPTIAAFSSSQLYIYIQAISGFLAPPVAAIYLLGILWPRLNEQGAFWGLIIGFAVGMVRLGLELGYKIPSCGSMDEDPRPEWVKVAVGGFHYLHYAGFSFVFTCAIASIVAVTTKPIHEDTLHRLTYWSRHSTIVRRRHSTDDQPEDYDGWECNEAESQFSDEKQEGQRAKGTKANVAGAEEQPNSSLFKLLTKLCCLQPKTQASGEENLREEIPESPQKTEEELAVEAVMFLQESRFNKRFMNSLAVLAMCLASFVWGFYA